MVCLSEHVPSYRARLIESYGAEVCISGKSQDETENTYNILKKEKNLIPVVPFDDPAVIVGQGTIGVEMIAAVPDLDAVLVPLSGGGLLSGIALAVKSIHPGIRVIGVSIERSPAMLLSVQAGKPVRIEEKDTLADSLLGGIGDDNRFILSLVRDLVDEHIMVTEREIEEAMAFAFSRHSLVIEGAAAVGIAALLSEKISVAGKKAGVVISGSSVDGIQYLEVLTRQVTEK